MCDPVSIGIATVATSALSAGVSYGGQKTAANEQEVYQEELFEAREEEREQNQENTIAAYEEEIATENLIGRQQETATSQDNLSMIKEAMRASGLAQAGSMGGGNGSAQVALDIERQEAEYTHNANRTLVAQLQQGKQRKKAARVKAISSINSVTAYIPATVQHPSLLAAGLQVAGSAVGAYSTYYNRTIV